MTGMNDVASTKMLIEVLDGPPGSGKSTVMRDEAEAVGGRYVFAYPTIPLLREQAKALRAAGKLIVNEVHSKSPGKGTVKRRLAEAMNDAASSGIRDVAVLTTHETFMGCDPTTFTDWHIRIDEAPVAAQSGKVRIPTSRDIFKAKFGLAPVGTKGWHEVQLLDEADRWTDIAADDLTARMAEFMKQAARPAGVYVDVSSWDERSFRWCAIWSPHVFEGIPSSMTIAGASYAHSIGALIAKDRVRFRYRSVPMARSETPTIRIHYFTHAHRGTSTFWATSEGRKMVVQVCDYLTKYVPDLGFWSGNDVVKILMEHRLSGQMIDAKALGRNEYDDLRSCAFIYSSTVTPDDEPLKELAQLTDAQIERAREEEDVLQFAMRGAIRKRDFGGDYDIYLYTKKQADDLALKLNASQVGIVTVIPITAAGILTETATRKKTSGAKPDAAKPRTKIKSSRTGKMVWSDSEAKNTKRAKDNSPKRPVGRPRKDAIQR